MSNRRPLSELDPELRTVKTSPDAAPTKCVRFRCPDCLAAGKHEHFIMVPFEGPSIYRGESMWRLVDANIATLTLQPSINCDVRPEYSESWSQREIEENERTRCKFHGFVTNGEVTW